MCPVPLIPFFIHHFMNVNTHSHLFIIRLQWNNYIDSVHFTEFSQRYTPLKSNFKWRYKTFASIQDVSSCPFAINLHLKRLFPFPQ